MKFFLYKIIFPECHKLYWGRTCREFRYGRQNPVGHRFVGPHHNPEVQTLLDFGFTAFFIRTGWCSSEEQSKQIEGNFLHKVWPSGEWSDRPRWLLNRTNKPVGFATGEANPRFLPHNQQACIDRAAVLHTPEANAKRVESMRRWRSQPGWVHPSIGVNRPDVAERNKTPERRVKASQTVSKTNRVLHECPECGMFFNSGNLAKHLRARHGAEKRLAAGESGLPTE